MGADAVRVVLAGPAAGILAYCLVGLFLLVAPRLGLIDMPNQRSSHRLPTPRAGGIGFVVATPLVAVAALAWTQQPLPAGLPVLVLGSVMVAAVGLADDRRGLPVLSRFIAYFITASILVIGLGPIDRLEWPEGPGMYIGWLGIPVTLLWVVGLTNVYNFMDGIDGIAAAQAIIAMATAAFIAFVRGETGQAVYMVALAGGVGGFLMYNWPPARVFMGDIGSVFLGYSTAGLALITNDGKAVVPFSAWVILMSPFIFDSGITLVGRILRGERWYEAHREHLYQRLVAAGWNHRAVTTLYAGLSLYLALMVISHFLLHIGTHLTVIVLTALPLLVLLVLVKLVEAKSSSTERRIAGE